MTTITDLAGDKPRSRRGAPQQLRKVGTFVDRRVSGIQYGYLGTRTGEGSQTTSRRRPDPGAIADLALLRRAVGKPVDACLDVWRITLRGLKVHTDKDEPTHEELAAHTAITLYAVHQQSRSEAMHRRGVGLGEAVRRLARDKDVSSDAVDRRFTMIGTAATISETTHHLRGLVKQLRTARIPLDYGVLADDLDALQIPGRANGIRLTWGRDYHRVTNTTDEPDDPTDGETT